MLLQSFDYANNKSAGQHSQYRFFTQKSVLYNQILINSYVQSLLFGRIIQIYFPCFTINERYHTDVVVDYMVRLLLSLLRLLLLGQG